MSRELTSESTQTWRISPPKATLPPNQDQMPSKKAAVLPIGAPERLRALRLAPDVAQTWKERLVTSMTPTAGQCSSV